MAPHAQSTRSTCGAWQPRTMAPLGIHNHRCIKPLHAVYEFLHLVTVPIGVLKDRGDIDDIRPLSVMVRLNSFRKPTLPHSAVYLISTTLRAYRLHLREIAVELVDGITVSSITTSACTSNKFSGQRPCQKGKVAYDVGPTRECNSIILISFVRTN